MQLLKLSLLGVLVLLLFFCDLLWLSMLYSDSGGRYAKQTLANYDAIMAAAFVVINCGLTVGCIAWWKLRHA